MKGSKLIAALLLAIALPAFTSAGVVEWYWSKRAARFSGDALAWKEHAGHPPEGIIPEYGKVPHFQPNPYPWHVPLIFSGFRHYNVAPPWAAEMMAAPPQLLEQAPRPREQVPSPKKGPQPKKAP